MHHLHPLIHPRSRCLMTLGLGLSLVAACGDTEEPGVDQNNGPTVLTDAGTGAPWPDGSAPSAQDSGSSPAADATTGNSDAGSVTPANDTAWCKAKAVLDQRCATCHDGKGSAGTPMGLTSYADLIAASTKFPGKKTHERVQARIHDSEDPMPPGGGLSTEELAALDGWLNSGAEAGSDPTCSGSVTPPAQDSWPSHCDGTYKLLAHAPGSTAPFKVPAREGEFKPYQSHPQISLDAPWGNEEVQMIAYRAITDKKPVVHHWILYEQTAGGSKGAFLQGWSPGKDSGNFPDDVGMIMPKGAKSMVLDFHYYNNTDQAFEDASGLEVCVLKKANFRKNSAGVFSGFSNILGLSVSRGEMNKDIVSTCTIRASQPITMITSSPHMHVLGVHAKLEVVRKNGERLMVHDKAFYFEEQTTTRLKPAVVLNDGDKVITTCRYSFPKDDTFHVDANGRPINTVTFGVNTENEMCFNFAAYYPKGGFSCAGLLPPIF